VLSAKYNTKHSLQVTSSGLSFLPAGNSQGNCSVLCKRKNSNMSLSLLYISAPVYPALFLLLAGQLQSLFAVGGCEQKKKKRFFGGHPRAPGRGTLHSLKTTFEKLYFFYCSILNG
jgi:hypothetical protein